LASVAGLAPARTSLKGIVQMNVALSVMVLCFRFSRLQILRFENKKPCWPVASRVLKSLMSRYLFASTRYLLKPPTEWLERRSNRFDIPLTTGRSTLDKTVVPIKMYHDWLVGMFIFDSIR
jgi:hypothetical protein